MIGIFCRKIATSATKLVKILTVMIGIQFYLLSDKFDEEVRVLNLVLNLILRVLSYDNLLNVSFGQSPKPVRNPIADLSLLNIIDSLPGDRLVCWY